MIVPFLLTQVSLCALFYLSSPEWHTNIGDAYYNYQVMKDRLLSIMDIIAFTMFAVLLVNAGYRQQTSQDRGITDIWMVPFVGGAVYLLFQVFINHPVWLIKKTREHYENHNQPSDEIVLKWGRAFHFLRLFFLFGIMLFSIILT